MIEAASVAAKCGFIDTGGASLRLSHIGLGRPMETEWIGVLRAARCREGTEQEQQPIIRETGSTPMPRTTLASRIFTPSQPSRPGTRWSAPATPAAGRCCRCRDAARSAAGGLRQRRSASVVM
jgi:hypothetical protein